MFAIAAFVGASSVLAYALALIMDLWITAIEVKARSLALRLGISAFIGYGLGLLIAVGGGCGLIWCGVNILIDSADL